MANSNWSFLQTFTPQFQAMRSELESRIEAAKAVPSPPPDVLQELTLLLGKATKALADATGSIPTYDQKQYEIQMKGLEKSIVELRASNAPKSRFAFKRKPQAPTAPTAPPTEASTKDTPVVNPAPSPSSTSSNLSLSSHSHKYLTRSDLPDHPQQTDLSVSDLDNCIVDLLPSITNGGLGEYMIISALHARNLTNCVLLLPAIEGSALLHDLTRCVIVLGSHQFRMHSSKKIDVLLSISSNPIIEDCDGIRFTQYPTAFRTSIENSRWTSHLNDISQLT
ncbi:tubulin binding cofactor C-domain-containing protein [Flammula alnicola]|nr:tubulin binding cofactor C-domain-containing protein [Flammula alnicola]